MVRERDDWGYYVRAIRDFTNPPTWRWRIIRRGNPMGVLLEAGGFHVMSALPSGTDISAVSYELLGALLTRSLTASTS